MGEPISRLGVEDRLVIPCREAGDFYYFETRVWREMVAKGKFPFARAVYNPHGLFFPAGRMAEYGRSEDEL